MKTRRMTSLMVGLTLCFFSGTATASLYLSQDRTAFMNASAASAVGDIPYYSYNVNSFSVAHLTFSTAYPSSFYLRSPDLSARMPGLNIALNSRESFSVSSAESLYSFGFDFHEPETDPYVNAPFVDSEFKVTLKNNGTEIDSFSFNRPNDSLQFVGVWSSEAFNQVEISEVIGGIDNEFFGNFVTGTEAIPEPLSVAFIAFLLPVYIVRRNLSFDKNVGAGTIYMQLNKLFRSLYLQAAFRAPSQDKW